ncbi:MAG: transglycosylase SLT domain-containing protein [Dysgonamonadaceae bacterium]|jgi:membrane-bound lytic murein transglycosylase D|nr:transglycosylase SLT domain-containing protein [Dysgonamonadaceae bacterium]
MKRNILILLLMLSCVNSAAQNNPPAEDNATVEPEAIENGLDALMKAWHVQQHDNKMNHEGYEAVAAASDSDYIRRLQSLPYVIPMSWNPIVRTSIERYVGQRAKLVEYMLGLESLYFPMIEENLDRYGLPLELKYLAIIESALNTTALSRAGAAGLWQFMLPTAKLYGLEINSLIDERLDPNKSTEAACRFLKDLYNIYQDWNLAIAAYNCGAGNVNKAVRRAGGNKDFWKIYPYLPRETRAYVPYFIAAAYVMNYFAYHRLYPVEISAPAAADTIMINYPLHFDQIAAILNINKEEIKTMNPQYKRGIIPGNYKPMPLKLPVSIISEYITREDEIKRWHAASLLPKTVNLTNPALNKPLKITHKVKSGETLIKIGNHYGVSASSIRKWNRLGRSVICVPAGRKLILYVDNAGF